MEKVYNPDADIATLKNEVGHINKHLLSIDKSMRKLQDLMLEQNDLRKDIMAALKEHEEMKNEMSGFGRRVSNSEKEIVEIRNKFENMPLRFKSNIVDYVWKYAAVAIGGWLALKITGILP